MSGDTTRHRAKVYCLNDEGQWDDRGTGQAFIQYIPVRPAAAHSHSHTSVNRRLPQHGEAAAH